MKKIPWGITAGVVALMIRFVFGSFPAMAENVYGKTLYPVVRELQSFLFSWLPFPAGIVFILLLIICSIFFLLALLRKKYSLRRIFLKIMNVLGWGIFLFLFLWGFNYSRMGIGERLELSEVEIPNDDQWNIFYLKITEQALTNRINAGLAKGDSVTHFPLPEESLAELSIEIKNITASLGYPGVADLPVRFVKPGGILRRLGIAGIYNPFTGEPNTDASFTSLPGIFTSAHEMAHAQGITNEGDANFVAWLACSRSKNALVRYAADYTLWRHLLYSAPLQTDSIQKLNIPEELSGDAIAIRRDNQKYKGLFPGISTSINDTYLKFQGIEEGTRSYDRLAELAYAYSAKKGMKK